MSQTFANLSRAELQAALDASVEVLANLRRNPAANRRAIRYWQRANRQLHTALVARGA